MKTKTVMTILATLLVYLVIFSIISINEAEAKEWRAGVSVTVPLSFHNIMDRGTMTMHIEAYDAEVYNSIDNSVVNTHINNSSHSRSDVRNTTNNIDNSRHTSNKRTVNVDVSGNCSHHNVHVK